MTEDPPRTLRTAELDTGEYVVRIYSGSFERLQHIELTHPGVITITCDAGHLVDILTLDEFNRKRSL